MLIPTCFEGNDVYEYAAYLGMKDAAVNGARNPRLFRIESELGAELRSCYDLGYDMEVVSSEFYLGLTAVQKVFLRQWDYLTGWGVLETVANGKVKEFDFSYHDLKPEMAGISLDPGETFTITYRVIDEKILSITK